MGENKPSVGRIVHYVSYGTPGGEYKPEHRAAIITGVIDDNNVQLCVLNPSGIFFHDCTYDGNTKTGGTWHWPERIV